MEGRAQPMVIIDKFPHLRTYLNVIRGEKERLFAVEYGERAAKIIPNATFLLIEDAGHLPLMDQPDIFDTILSGFLKK